MIGVLGVVAASSPGEPCRLAPLQAAHRCRVGALSFTFWEQLRDRAPRAVCTRAASCSAAAFVTTYNYVTYHLLAAPYSLSHTAVGFIFLVYLVGIFASAWIGSLADRVGRAHVLLPRWST